MNFEVKTKHGKLLKSVVNLAATITDETKLIATERGIIFSGADPGRICIIYVVIPKSLFENFNVTGTKEIPISLDSLNKILNRITNEKSTTLKFDEMRQRLNVVIQKPTGQIKTFSMTILGEDPEEINIDAVTKIKYENDITIKLDVLLDAMSDASIYGETIDVNLDVETGVIFSTSAIVGDMENKIGKNNLQKHHITSNASATYAMNYLQHLKKILPVVNEMTIFLRDDYPIKILFNMKEGIKLFFYMAPRVEKTA